MLLDIIRLAEQSINYAYFNCLHKHDGDNGGGGDDDDDGCGGDDDGDDVDDDVAY